MLPNQNQFPRRGVAARRPMLGRPARAMLTHPSPGPNIGAFEDVGPSPQDPVGSIVREFRTSLTDVATAVRLGFRGRRNYFGTTLVQPHQIEAPSEANEDDSVRAAVQSADNAPRSLNKVASRGTPVAEYASKARQLPQRPR